MTIQQWSGVRLASVETSGNQDYPDVAVLEDGRFVVTWASSGDIFYRIFEADGTPQTDEVQVNFTAFPGANFDNPTIAAYDTGGFFIAADQTGATPGIARAIFDVNGTIVDQGSIVTTVNGNVSEIDAFESSSGDVFMVFVDGGGEPRVIRYTDSTFGATFTVPDVPAGTNARNVSGTELADGNIVVTWQNGTDLFYQIMDDSGVSVTGFPNAVNLGYAGSTSANMNPEVVALGNGGFVIVQRTSGAPFPGDGSDILLHVVRPDGFSFDLNEYVDPSGTLGSQANATVVATADGGFMVIWTDAGNTDGNVMYARTFNGLGEPTSSRFIVTDEADNSTAADGEMHAALMPDGRVVVSFQSSILDSLDPSGDGVFFTIIDPRDGQVVGIDGGNNMLYGSLGNDNILGDDGNDTAYGLAGNDFINGGDGTDMLDGGDGEDILIGGRGNDTLIGGDGNDILEGVDGQDDLQGGSGTDTASYLTSNGGVIVNLAFNIGQSNDAEGDTFSSIENVFGSNANDIIRGTSGVNELHGAGGSDQLLGDAGDDILFGGRGNDILRGGAGADQLIGGTGFDVADYTDSAARVLVNLFFGNALEGDAQGDTLASVESVFGSAFNDIIRGTNGSNALRGNGGNDILRGDGGADLFQYADTNWGNDLIEDFTDGVDQLDLRGSGLAFGDLTITTSGSDTFVSITSVPSSAILLDNFVGTIDAADFIF